MFRRLNLLTMVFLLAGMAGAQQPPAEPNAGAKSSANLPSEETVNTFMRATFGFDPSIHWKISRVRPSVAAGLAEVDIVLTTEQGSQEQKFYVTPDGTHVLIGDVLPFGPHPFAGIQKELENGINGPAQGPADAPVTLVEFSDLQCPHCKDAQPAVAKLMAENKNVRLVFQNFPLPMHDWAAKAAAYADCVSRSSNAAFWKFIDSVYGAQSDLTASNAEEKLSALADAAGVKGADIAVCAAKPETTTRIEQSEKLAKKLDVDATPTFFVNGRKVPAVPYEVFVKLVEFAAKPGNQ
jgi:protein-disulfide isomerase